MYFSYSFLFLEKWGVLCSIKTVYKNVEIMDTFKDIVRKSFAQKSMWKRMIGTVWIKVVQDFFWDKNIEWFIRFSTLYIKTTDQQLKIKAYQQKEDLLAKVNEELKKLGYKRNVTDIRF